MRKAIPKVKPPPPFRDPDNQNQAEIDDITPLVLELN